MYVHKVKAIVRIQPEDGHVQTKERTVRRNQTCKHFDLGLLASRILRNKYLLFKPPSL